MSNLDLDTILTTAEQAYAAAKNDADDLGADVGTASRQHFERDVPALIAAVNRLSRALEWAASLDARESTEGEIRNAIKRAQAALRPGTEN